ncbi:type VI secretion system-associated FHA domain protein TagH [Mesorhizobium caraganae]|uniref:type VI secretion system-associated FHA domain protein TagH n=1 Tax=Mesorhizobium caraganae TaxID=483206 RepID=UPI00193A8EFA|nr:type VI secretion system-associated FHA domain protein TagH [Mesorhizobium caraganae]MBM2716054.1 type VI secretion system-associated FHA domain protein TagH [Mesorhizobium caraganae]
MPLVLCVTNTQAGLSGSRGTSWLIESDGGLSVGVSEDNGFVLSDDQQAVSTHRFSIERAEGEFVLIERSGNGTSLNDGAKPLPSDLPVNLTAGDIVRIGSYIINVDAASMEDSAEGEPHTVGSLEASNLLGVVEMAPAMSVGKTTRLGELFVEPFDGDFLPASFLDAEQDLSPATVGAWRMESYPDHIPDQAGIFVQPASCVETIPEDWDLATELKTTQASTIAPSFTSVNKDPALETRLGLSSPAPEEPSRSMVAGQTDAGGQNHAAVAAFLAACGLSLADLGQTDISTMMDRAGRMLLNSVVGLGSALAACEHAPQEPGLQCTMTAQPVENPLKFMLDAKDALRAALCADTPRLLHGGLAVEHAFADIKAHEGSMLTALHKALLSVRERLCSEAIEASVARTRQLWPGSRKTRLWGEYCRVFDSVVTDIENETLRSIGVDFGLPRRENIASMHKA